MLPERRPGPGYAFPRYGSGGSRHGRPGTRHPGQGPVHAGSTTGSTTGSRSGGVQSIERAFALLEMLADAGGTHRAVPARRSSPGCRCRPSTAWSAPWSTWATCARSPSRQYVLGPRLIRLGESSSRMLSTWARPHLTRLVDELGESANLALLDGDQIVYVAQVPVAALDADVHRGRPPGAAALHRRRQGDHGRDGRPRRSATSCAAPACPGTPSTPSPTPTSSPASSSGRPSTGTRSTRASRRSACAVSP